MSCKVSCLMNLILFLSKGLSVISNQTNNVHPTSLIHSRWFLESTVAYHFQWRIKQPKRPSHNPIREDVIHIVTRDLSIDSWNIEILKAELLKAQDNVVWAAQSSGSQQLSNSYRHSNNGNF